MGDNAKAGIISVICLILSGALFGVTPSDLALQQEAPFSFPPVNAPTDFLNHYNPSSVTVIQVSPQLQEYKRNLAAVKTWEIAYTSGSLSPYDASWIASHFDLLDTDFGLAASTVTAMHTANADLKVIGYRDLIAMKTSYADWATVDANEAWFLHDSGGNRIYRTASGWWLMDPANAGWRAHYIDQINTAIAAGGYDGVFADDCWNEVSDYQSSFDRTIQAADVASWHADMVAFVAYVKANISSGKLVIVNNDEWYSSDYVTEADGEMLEGFIHPDWKVASDHSDRPTALQVAQIDKLVTDTAAGKIVLCQSGSSDSTLQANMLNGCYAAFLSGANLSLAYFAYNSWYHADTAKGYYALMDFDVGTASGAYTYEDNVYKRTFTRVKSVFNPASSGYSVAIGASYLDAYDNSAEASTITVSAYSGITLIRPYTVTSSATTGGTVSPNGSTTIAYGSSQVYTPSASAGYFFNYWTLDGSVYGSAANPLTYSGADAGSTHTLITYFTLYTPIDPQVYYVEAYAGQGGSVSPSGQSVVEYPAGHIDLTATASYGYTFTRWKLNGAAYSTNATIAYSAGTPPNVYIFTAEFTADPAPTPTYTITASAGANGAITNSGVNVVAVGTAYTSLATANGGYIFSHWTRAAIQYSTANPISISLSQGESTTLVAVFIADTETPPDPEEPDPTPQPAPLTPSTQFSSLASALERQTPDGNIWDSYVWAPGVFDDCKAYRNVERQLEKTTVTFDKVIADLEKKL